ncbi:MAG: sulfatase-like hydrolase/transferase [Pseudomonadota bacterium]
MNYKPPNIVLIIADHVAFAGHYAHPRFDYRWPGLERLAAEGAWFNNAYAITPVCTPSRASLLTGKRPDKHGMRWNCEYPIPYNRTEFRDDEVLYCQALANAGYDNHYVGKWHVGTNKGPADYGLGGWSLPEYGNVYSCEAYRDYLQAIGEPHPTCLIEHHLLQPELNGTRVVMQPEQPWDYMDGAGVLSGSSEVHEQFFVANMATQRLRDLAAAQNTGPFSMVVSLWGPHHPYYPSEDFAALINPADIPQYPSFDEDLKDKPLRYRVQRDLRCQHRAGERWPDWKTWQSVMARCYASGLQTDAAVSRVLDTLTDTGLVDNTLVIVTADHGDGIAAHGAGWDKYSSFTEEVGRVPLVMRWPGQIPPDTTVNDPVNLLDVTATMLEAGQASIEHPLAIDGEDLMPFMTAAKHRDHMICDHFGHSGDVCFQKIVYANGWKYVSAYSAGDELYDLNTDPFELHNLIDNPSTHQRQLQMRQMIIDHYETRREEREAWHSPEFWERGIVYSSAEWPRDETLHLYQLQQQQHS